MTKTVRATWGEYDCDDSTEVGKGESYRNSPEWALKVWCHPGDYSVKVLKALTACLTSYQEKDLVPRKDGVYELSCSRIWPEYFEELDPDNPYRNMYTSYGPVVMRWKEAKGNRIDRVEIIDKTDGYGGVSDEIIQENVPEYGPSGKVTSLKVTRHIYSKGEITTIWWFGYDERDRLKYIIEGGDQNPGMAGADSLLKLFRENTQSKLQSLPSAQHDTLFSPSWGKQPVQNITGPDSTILSACFYAYEGDLISNVWAFSRAGLQMEAWGFPRCGTIQGIWNGRMTLLCMTQQDG